MSASTVQSPATASKPPVPAQAPTATPATPAVGQVPAAKPAGMRPSPYARASSPSPYRFYPTHFSRRAELYYQLYWGVDSLRVKYAESGEIIRFSYRVLDTNKASPLNDKKVAPSLVDPRARVKLVVPSLEQVGLLRQSGPPQQGKMYWMAFSNKGRLVRSGDHVNLVIGDFRANGLVVE